jgi:hypothetical protein
MDTKLVSGFTIEDIKKPYITYQIISMIRRDQKAYYSIRKESGIYDNGCSWINSPQFEAKTTTRFTKYLISKYEPGYPQHQLREVLISNKEDESCTLKFYDFETDLQDVLMFHILEKGIKQGSGLYILKHLNQRVDCRHKLKEFPIPEDGILKLTVRTRNQWEQEQQGDCCVIL